MTWAKLSDDWWRHPKLMRVSLAASGLWSRAASWCGDQLTDGRVPRDALKCFGGATTKHASELVAARLWHETPDGWEFHQWLERNPSREQVLAERAAAAERKRLSREKASGRRPVSQGPSHSDTHRDYTPESHPLSHDPDPTRPDPVNSLSGNVERTTWADVLKLVNDATGTLHNPSPKNRQACETIAAIQSPEDIRAAAAAMKADGWARDNGAGAQHFADSFARYLARARKPPTPEPPKESDGKARRQKMRDDRDRSTDPAERKRITDAIAESQRADGVA